MVANNVNEKDILEQLEDYIYPKSRQFEELAKKYNYDEAELFKKIKILEGKDEVKGIYGMGREAPSSVGITAYGLAVLDEMKHSKQVSSSQRNSTITNTIQGNENIPISLQNINNSTINIAPQKNKQISVGADHSYNMFTKISEWLFRLIGEKKYNLVSLLGSIFGVLGTVYSYLNFGKNGQTLFSYLMFFSIILLIFSIILYFIPRISKCKKCGSLFSLISEDRKVVGKEKIGNELIINYEETFKCNKCGEKLTKNSVDRIMDKISY